ncbi:hypothetical protein [Sphingomonas sp.]|uniref:hypothetical protein n=1 Tax=Sphingomonas sp. TaxID=28214 RepID=UPI00389FD6DE
MTRRLHLPILTLLAAALFLRAIVPVGWMPAPQRGVFAIEPCPSAETAPIMLMAHGSSGHHHDHGSIGSDCFASMLAGAGLPDDAIQIAAPAPARVVLSAAFTPARLIRGPPGVPPPSTGPPTIA